MPKATNYADNWFLLLDNNTTYANVGNAAGLVGSSGAGSPGSLYVSLHTGDPAIPGFPSIQQTVPQYVNWFGYNMKPILDVLKLRYPRIKYISPPVCQSLTPKSGSSSSVFSGWV
jgi:hypothetical protein